MDRIWQIYLESINLLLALERVNAPAALIEKAKERAKRRTKAAMAWILRKNNP